MEFKVLLDCGEILINLPAIDCGIYHLFRVHEVADPRGATWQIGNNGNPI